MSEENKTVLNNKEIDFLMNLIKTGKTLQEIGVTITKKHPTKLIREKIIEKQIHSLPYVSIHFEQKIDDNRKITIGIVEPTTEDDYKKAHDKLLDKVLESTDHIVDIIMKSK